MKKKNYMLTISNFYTQRDKTYPKGHLSDFGCAEHTNYKIANSNAFHRDYIFKK